MKALELWIFAYVVNSLWQIPLAFAAGWLATRAVRFLGANAEHWVWVSTLLLQCLLPALSSFSWQWPLTLFTAHSRQAAEGHVQVFSGPGRVASLLTLPAPLLSAVVISYLTLISYFMARFLWRMAALRTLRREAAPLVLTEEARQFWTRCTRRFRIDHASLAVSHRIFGPVTMGARQKLLLLPANMAGALPPADLCTVIAHECAHMSRHDYLKNLFYECLSLPAAYHPVLQLTRRRIMATREMICDQMAAEMTGQIEYASSLLRLAASLLVGTPVAKPHTIGIFDTTTFERRIMRLTENHEPAKRTSRVAAAVACAALGLAVCGSAAALGMHGDDGQAQTNGAPAKQPRQLAVSEKALQGNLMTKVMPVYPEEARKAKIQGTVLLEAVIGKTGDVENLRVVSGPKELQQASLDCVRQWKYKPYLLNGDPIEVKTEIRVVYTL